MSNIYLIYGTDYTLIKRKIDSIIDGNLDVVKYDLSVSKVDELLDDASCISIFGDKKIIIGENSTFLTASSNAIQSDFDYLEKYLKSDNHDNIIIFWVLSDKLDERKKIVKLLKQKAQVFTEMAVDEKNLNSFIVKEFQEKGYEIDIKTANYFINYVGKNIDIIHNEIDKMILYKQDNKKILIDDIVNISSKAFKDNIFDFTDAIMKKNYKKMFDCYEDLVKLNEEPVKLISLIANQVILIYQVKILGSYNKTQKEITEVLKIHPYRVKLAYESDFFISELEEMIKSLHELDYGIKKGSLDKNDAFKEFLIKL